MPSMRHFLSGVSFFICVAAHAAEPIDQAELVKTVQSQKAAIERGRLTFTIYDHDPSLWEAFEREEFQADEEQKRREYQVLRRAHQLNSQVMCSGELVFDHGVGVYKLSLRDTRDLMAVATANKNPLNRIGALSRSRTAVARKGGKNGMLYLPDEGRGVLSIMPRLRDSRWELPYDFGNVSAGISESPALMIDEIPNDDHACLTLRLQGTHANTEVLVDPEKQYRYRRLEIRTKTGEMVSESIASDYQLVSGIWVPFYREDRSWSASGELRSQKIVRLERVDLNCPITESELGIDLEQGDRITHLLGWEPGGYYALEPLTVTLRDVSDIDRLAKESNKLLYVR